MINTPQEFFKMKKKIKNNMVTQDNYSITDNEGNRLVLLDGGYTQYIVLKEMGMSYHLSWNNETITKIKLLKG